MCGITGIISKNKISELERSQVKKMNDALIHRGPNSEGLFEKDNVSIAMRRLSIIDLSGGNQPLFNEDKTIVLIANGEIYNFVELREELEKRGHVFSTKSDCETIIHSYEEYGENFVEKLRGMFAFCLYDTKNNKVILCRDRLGEKPLYIIKDDNYLAFSSEFKSIVNLIDKKNRKLSLDSINYYFHYQFVPEPYTMIDKITKLDKGSMLIIDTKNFSIQEKKYWSFDNIKEKSGNPIETIKSDLNDVEKIIIRSDVPIGISLSGGIDSSIIAILAKKYSKDKINAISVGYTNHPENDERKLAEALAKDLNIEFHQSEISKQEFVSDFTNMVYMMDDPIADIAAYGYYRVSKNAYENKIPVLFAGFGGDELFWGYKWVVDTVALNKLKHGFSRIKLFIKLLNNYKSYIKRRPFVTLLSIFKMSFDNGYIFYEISPSFYSTLNKHKDIFTENFRGSVNKNKLSYFYRNSNKKDPETESVRIIFDLWMTGNCIPIGDRLSMAHSVEMRLPMLDYKFIEDIVGTRKTNRNDYKIGYKSWLIEATKDILPKEIVERKKRGFTPPIFDWVNEIINNKKDRIVSGYLVTNNILEKDFIINSLKDIRSNKDFLYKVLVLEEWIGQYILK